MTFTCKEFVEILLEFIDGELSDERRQQVQTHLDGCPPCVTYVETYHVTVKICRKLQQKEPPDSLRERFIKAAQQLPPDSAAHGAGR